MTVGILDAGAVEAHIISDHLCAKISIVGDIVFGGGDDLIAIRFRDG
jgi:hypothetical protein